MGMIDPLKAPPEVIHRLNQLKASCKVIRVNKVEVEDRDTQIIPWKVDRGYPKKAQKRGKK
jgi:hypothetical protein